MAQETLKQGKWYHARVEGGARFVKSRNKQTPYISVMFLLTNTDSENPETVEGQFWCTEAAMERTYAMVKKLGFDLRSEDLTLLSARIENAECEVDLQIQEYRGEKQPRVNDLRLRGESGIDTTVLVEVATLFGNTATQIPVETKEGQSSSDVPF